MIEDKAASSVELTTHNVCALAGFALSLSGRPWTGPHLVFKQMVCNFGSVLLQVCVCLRVCLRVCV